MIAKATRSTVAAGVFAFVVVVGAPVARPLGRPRRRQGTGKVVAGVGPWPPLNTHMLLFFFFFFFFFRGLATIVSRFVVRSQSCMRRH